MTDLKVKIECTDFWSDFDVKAELLFKWIRENIVVSRRPDILFYSVFGRNNYEYDDCIRVFYTGENVRPDFSECHYAMSFDRLDRPNHLRLPFYRLNEEFHRLYSPACITSNKPDLFCNFIHSKSYSHRENIFKALNQYKTVHAPGKSCHNTTPINSDSPHSSRGRQTWENEKISYQQRFKFSLACENERHPGYITEKITDAFLAGTVPIYWGALDVTEDFNPNCFINANTFSSLSDLVEYVKKVDNDDLLYKSFFREAPIINSEIKRTLSDSHISNFFNKILTSPAPYLVRGLKWKKIKRHVKDDVDVNMYRLRKLVRLILGRAMLGHFSGKLMDDKIM